MGFRYATLLLVVASFCCGVAGDSNNATEEFTTTVAMTTTPSIETTTEAATTTTIPPTTHEHGPQQPPHITSIDPVTGNTKGGESFTVMGTDLHYDGKSTQVFFTGSAFGERPCLDVRAGEQVTCKTPSGIGENIAVKISVGDMNATSSMMFNYDAPVVASITPAAVPYTANMTFADYTITIAGTNFGAPSLGTFAAMLQTSAGNNVSLASPTRTSQETATATLAVVGTGSQSEGMARVFVSLDARQSNSLDFWFAKGSPVFDLAVSSDSQPQKDDLQSQLSRLLGVTPKQIFVTSVSAASRRSIALRATTYAVVFQVLSINDSAADEAQTKLEAAARDGTLANTIAGAQSIKAGDGEPVKVEDKNEPSSEGSSGSGGKKGMPGWAIAIIVILVIGVVVLGVIFFRKRQSRRKEGGIEMYEPHNIPSAASFRPDTNVV